MKMEVRFNNADIEAHDDGSMTVSGYVNKTNEYSEMLGHSKRFKEKIAKGVFLNALKKAKDIHFLAEHDKSKILASTRNGSLTLHEDDEGLFMTATICATSWGKDYYELIKSGILCHMSFGFKTVKDSWKKRSDYFERIINDLELFEVSVVRDPAYASSTISARGIDLVEDVELLENARLSKKEKREIKNEMIGELVRLNKKQIRKEEKDMHLITTSSGFNLEDEKRAIESMLKGDETEIRDMGIMSGNGSSMVSNNVSNEIVSKLNDVAPLFARTKQIPTVAGTLSYLKENDEGSAQWLEEFKSAVPTDFGMDAVKFEQKRVVASVRLSNQLVNDAAFDIVDYSLNEMVKRLGNSIETAIVNGDGNKQPTGFLNAELPTESILYTESVNAISTDDVLTLYQSMHQQLVEDSVFVVSREVFNQLSKLKDSTGHYYLVDFKNGNNLVPVFQMLGRPVFISNAMPSEIKSGVKAVALVNLGAGYGMMIKQAIELKHVTEDTAQSLAGAQLMLAEAYIDGNVINEQAIKILQVQ